MSCPNLFDSALQAGEVLALGDQLLEQWRRLPDVAAIFSFEFLDVRQDIVETNLVCPEHWPAGDFWKAVTIDVDDIDVAGTNGDAIFQDSSTFIDHRIQATLKHFIVIDIVYINGYGFPEVTGGPMFWADQIGLDNILADIKKFEAEYGRDIWKPAPLLEKLVAEGKSFASLQD